MKAHSKLTGNPTRFENGVLSQADVLPIFQPLPEEQVRAFALQIDEELSRLEEKYAAFTTAKSMRGSLGR